MTFDEIKKAAGFISFDKRLAITGEVGAETFINPQLLFEDTEYMDKLTELLGEEVELREVVRQMVAWANENY